jgi:hypothetical protein
MTCNVARVFLAKHVLRNNTSFQFKLYAKDLKADPKFLSPREANT